jgi:hypothetical protein
MGHRFAPARRHGRSRYRAQYREDDRSADHARRSVFLVRGDYDELLGNVLENSLWTAAFLLIAIALLDLVNRFRGAVQLAIAASAAGIAGYVIFMCTVDVPVASFGLAKHILPRYRASPHIRRPVLGALAVTARSPRPMQ